MALIGFFKAKISSTCELTAGNNFLLAELYGQRLPVGETVTRGVNIDRVKPLAHQTDAADQLAALDAV